MTRQQITIVAVLGTLNLLVLCVGGYWLATSSRPSPSQPTAAAAAIATPTLSQLSPSPSTSSTPASATATLVLAPDPILAPIFNALEKTDSANSYRLQMDASASGSLAERSSNQNQVVLLSMTGEASGADSHFVMKGLAIAMLTTDPAKALEFASVGGRSYVKGPMPLLGAKENKWYVLPPGQSPLRESPSNLYSLFDTRGGKSSIAKGAAEKLDGHVCDVYVGDKNAALAAFINLGGASQLSASSSARLRESISSAEFKLWICDDGYLHQMRISFDGADQSQNNQRYNFKMLVHLFDFGTKISIVTPANAVAATPIIDLNSLFAPTATPLRIPTFGLPLPRFTPFATFSLPGTTPFPTFSFRIFFPSATPQIQ